MLVAERIGDLAPLRERLGLGLLGEDRPDHRRHRGTLLGADMGQQVAGPMHAAALETGVEDALGGRPQPLVVVGDHQPDAAQAAVGERA